jgi:8-oxo-dGTP pyrophosphatase MutT (NUDIX family)
LAVQQSDTALWQLPGGLVLGRETAEQALQRLVYEHTGIVPTIGYLVYIWQYRHKSTERLELFFVIDNPSDYRERQLKTGLAQSKELDDIGYLKPTGNPDLQPVFLQHEPVIAAAKQKNGFARFIHGYR